ncbi:MAG: CRISPR-associated endonuclease Cas2 [Rhodoferax sp.]|nr:CRISPR-associated endonuclease Cas2 [Rhodoferax sp.]
MGLNTSANWVFCYDIADKKRLSRIFRLLKSNGIAIQYSVFLVRANLSEINNLVSKIRTLIDTSRDDVRAYRLPSRTNLIMFGKPLFPEDMLFGCGIASLHNST